MSGVRIVGDTPRYKAWWWLVLAAFVGLLLWQLYYLGSQRGALRVGENLDDRAALLAVQDRSFVILEQQQKQLNQLQRQLDTQRKLNELEVQAGLEMQKELQSVLLQQHQLLEQVQFYENIVGSGAAKAGIRVSSLQLRPGETERDWWLQVTVTQVKKHNVRAEGKVTVSLYGLQGETPQELTLKHLRPEGLSYEKFGFHYFQNLDIALRLPEGFVPQELTVDIDIKRPKASQLLEQREWVELQR